jgi:hypothetical protein
MSKNKMKTGDMVLVIDSYGGGKPYIGSILPFRGTEEIIPYHAYPNCIHSVAISNNGKIFCEAVPLTPLLKALV